ncbi:MAG: pyridoxamine 5'-phosphate oxidase family protein [Nitrosopumilaceae archaeon]|nr:pyridoxamine 5'-phosphate oxidase family protein [Nitrosopumilaceae archaeon]
MKLLGKLVMRSPQKIAEFLESEHVGRIATIDKNGYPQVIPMNFAFVGGFIYMHSHIHGEKLDNMRRNSMVGFEVDRELEFLPSYFTHPTDASVADTLYVSVVIKGRAALVDDEVEKCLGLNGMMAKYQPEGGYEPLRPGDDVLDHTEVIRITSEEIHGKYKVGQHIKAAARADLAQKILDRRTPTAAATLDAMGFRAEGDRAVMVREPSW